MPDPKNRLKWNVAVKPYPAIGDLQGIETQVFHVDIYDCPSAGHYNRDGDVVPDGKVWYIVMFNGFNNSGVTGSIQLHLKNGDDLKATLEYVSGVAQQQLVYMISPLVMVKDDFLRARYTNCGNGDELRTSYVGYQIDLY